MFLNTFCNCISNTTGHAKSFGPKECPAVKDPPMTSTRKLRPEATVASALWRKSLKREPSPKNSARLCIAEVSGYVSFTKAPGRQLCSLLLTCPDVQYSAGCASAGQLQSDLPSGAVVKVFAIGGIVDPDGGRVDWMGEMGSGAGSWGGVHRLLLVLENLYLSNCTSFGVEFCGPI
eukprot:gnl/TRDRNA2_/TRDRNA2_128431_c1_seq1.p2 gnl/TRDRNA2_/TRDRNA2_128431_c1~~gnl/TRDRNA2_/TRDRNA2_128431_c1_seq1.p2  ORF type:complete len:176 (+),score=11.97 gnl/TRDRNA2_/TRDRNA2_128431_c1_seq1:257-784(+)